MAQATRLVRGTAPSVGTFDEEIKRMFDWIARRAFPERYEEQRRGAHGSFRG
jgi:hypothetical protein